MLCYCKSEKNFDACCEPYLQGKTTPSTPLELMRSRYSAYVLGDGEYLVATTTSENRYENDIALIKEYAKSVVWLHLEIITSTPNTVEFKAYYRDKSGIVLQHEQSYFVQENGRWFYTRGDIFHTKIERNAPCPCQSGKKYKKCCA